MEPKGAEAGAEAGTTAGVNTDIRAGTGTDAGARVGTDVFRDTTTIGVIGGTVWNENTRDAASTGTVLHWTRTITGALACNAPAGH